jgi:hypothetical protein
MNRAKELAKGTGVSRIGMSKDRRPTDALLTLGAELYGLHLRCIAATIEASLEVMTQYLQTNVAVQMPEIADEEVEAAAAALRRAMLDRHDLGFAVLLRTSFPDERLKEMAAAALRAARLRAGNP